MAYQHSELASGRFSELNFFSQMANLGAEVGRAINWRQKGKIDYAEKAFERSLELFDLTIADPKNLGRLKEVLRAREAWVDFFAYDNIYHSTAQQWQKYFLAFNWAANRNK